MMEFYAAYWNYRDLMDFTEALIRDAAQKAVGTLQLTYGGKPVDLAQPFERLTIREAIVQAHRCRRPGGRREWLVNALRKLGMTEEKGQASRAARWPACRCCISRRRWKTSCGSPPSSWNTRPRSRRWRAPTTSAPK
jgi:lysyl-tRNA synthetase class II